MPGMKLELRVARDTAGRAAYEAFTARNAGAVPWGRLSDATKSHWHAVALAAVSQVKPGEGD